MTEINLLTYLGKSNSEVYRMKTGELAVDAPKMESKSGIPSLAGIVTTLLMASFIALAIIFVTHYNGIEVSKRVMNNIMAQNELDFSLEAPTPPPLIETPIEETDVPEGFERFANIRFLEESAPQPPLTKAQQAALEEARRRAAEEKRQAEIAAQKKAEAKKKEAEKPKPPPPPSMFSLSFINLTESELTLVSELTKTAGAEAVVVGERTERFEHWEVYRISETSTLIIQGNSVELLATVATREEALEFARSADSPTVVRRNIVSREFYDVRVCCTTIEHAKNIAIGSNVRDRVIKIVKKQ